MVKKILRVIFTIVGGVLGATTANTLLRTNGIAFLDPIKLRPMAYIGFLGIVTLIFAIIFYLLSPMFNYLFLKATEYVETNIRKIPVSEVILGTVGAIIGLLISTLFFSAINSSSFVIDMVAIVASILLALLGTTICVRKKDEIGSILDNIKGINIGQGKQSAKAEKEPLSPKVLDTSVIIDGRILDLCQTGFIEGALIIPNFVLEELRHIADSSDDLKRNRGRRGLDILNKIQSDLDIEVKISEVDFDYISEVDSKLLKLAQVMDGKVVTNDYNLNKVAQFQGVPVLNINELANAIKPVVLPGETMKIQVVKDGKEAGQGIGYLDDGTMIVVEGGRRHMGEFIDVEVTSVLQTAAGRMIFARDKRAKDKAQ